MKEIKLTGKNGTENTGNVALVDDEDYEWLNQWKWMCIADCNTFYVKRFDYSNKKKKLVQMHRLILQLDDPKIHGDHKDHNGLNNQRSNLRIATYSQNQLNRRKSNSHKSKYVGVFSYGNQWKACCKKNGILHTAIKDSEIEAAIAYNEMATELHGEFANLNKIEMEKVTKDEIKYLLTERGLELSDVIDAIIEINSIVGVGLITLQDQIEKHIFKQKIG